MKYTLLLIIVSLTTIGCNDGDLIVEDLNFDNIELSTCTDPNEVESTNYFFYKINSTSNETIALQVNTNGQDIFSQSGIYGPFTLTTNLLEYRKLSGDPGNDYYCNNIPPTTPTTLQQLTGVSGNVYIETLITQDDNDGINAIDEGINLSDLTLSLDTDGDGIPDYIDIDDDGDNVPTINEGVDTDNLANSQDTDNDGIPDYLDNDDDGDGVLTIQEDLNRDRNPVNDIIGSTPNYLNDTATNTASPPIDMYIEHSYTTTTVFNIYIEDLQMIGEDREIIFNNYELGTYIKERDTIFTPNF